jgi:hypothetical protein
VVNDAPGVPPSPGTPKKTETVPKAGNPVINAFKEAIHGFLYPSIDKYADGVQIPATIVTPLDPTTDPMTHTMPVTLLPNTGKTMVFKSAVCTTVAATDVWAPTALKFRLIGFIIQPDAGLAAAGTETITLIEETLGTFGIAIQTYLPAAAGIVHQVPIVVLLPREGYLATIAGKKLQVTLSAAATAGGISVTAFGFEE